MIGESVQQGVGKILAKQIRLGDGITPSSAYQVTDVLQCTIWKGDAENVLAIPNVGWDQTLGPPNFLVQLVPSDTANLTPAVYSIQVVATRPSTGQTAAVWTSQIEVLIQPGAAPSQPVYIQLSDLMTELPTISSFQQQFRNDTGFEEQRHRARKVLDELCHRNARALAGISSNIYPSEWPYRLLVKSPVLDAYLAKNWLWLSQPLIEHQILLTLSYVFGGQTPANPKLYQELANHYRVRAELALRGCTAQVMGPQNDGTGAGTGNGVLLTLIDFSSSKCLRA